MTLAVAAHTYWWIALALGLAAALVVAALLALLVQSVVSIDRSVHGLLEIGCVNQFSRMIERSFHVLFGER